MKTWILTLLLLTLCVCSLSASELSAHGKIRQKRAWIIDSYSIEEENPGPFPYVLGTINVEKKYLVHFSLRGKGVDEEPTGVLSINSKTGTVSVHKKVDYELHSVLRLTFEALNDSNSMVDTRLGVEILINDINDNAPLFNKLHQETTLDESANQGVPMATVVATDADKPNTKNSTFQFRIASVTPKTDNVEFYIEQIQTAGTIGFKGCLDYEKAQKYTILIEAKDNGEKVQLSSTSTLVLNIKDENNHLPLITGQTGPAKVKEGTTGVEILRLQVSDRDSPATPAWKAKFTVHGDNANYFKIETDPTTNEGILTTIKELDYEEQITRNISVSVENEEPYFSCTVLRRPTHGTTWDIEKFTETSKIIEPKLYPLTITVEDVNEPPGFIPPVQKVTVIENTKIGTVLAHLKAMDPDKTSASSFRFIKGTDVENWVTVDANSGEISVVKLMDRESPNVNNSSYSVLVYVVDDATPPMTGTGTLIINLGDENDNIPTLVVNTLGICLSDSVTMTNLTAQDLDLPPFSAPFYFELQEDFKGSWGIEPSRGTTVNLVKGKDVYSGYYELQVKILDNQGMGQVHNLSVTVCDCTITPNCHVRRSVKAQASWIAIGIMISAFLLVMLLMAFLITCTNKADLVQTFCDDHIVVDSFLIKCNTEAPGTDCTLTAITQPNLNSNFVRPSNSRTSKSQMAHNGISRHESMVKKTSQEHSAANYSQNMLSRSDYWRSSTRSCQQVTAYGVTKSVTKKHVKGYEELLQQKEDFFHHNQAVEAQINKRLLMLQNPEQELCNYKPHCYASEGEPGPEPGMNLEAISLSEVELKSDDLSDLDFRFNKLAAMCRPDLKIPVVFNPNSFSL